MADAAIGDVERFKVISLKMNASIMPKKSCKLVYILLDGVGDRPDPTLNYVTPLEAAYTPSLDTLARRGVSGLVTTVGEGISPESDVAVFSMLGYDFRENYIGRGVVEAIGARLDFRDGDLALRGNFATISDSEEIIDRRVARSLLDDEAEELVKTLIEKVKLSKGAEFQLAHTVGHRAVLVLRVPDVHLSANISNTDTAYTRVGGMGVAKESAEKLQLGKAEALDEDALSILSAELVNEFTEKMIRFLKNHPVNVSRVKAGKLPANVILLRDAGNGLPRLTTLPERFGVKFASLVDMPVERGIATITGMVEYESGGTTDYDRKADRTISLLNQYDVIYVHIKGPDEPGHDGNARLKKLVIEQIDSSFLSKLLSNLNLTQTVVSISSDHSTPCQLKSHSSDPVSLLISGGSIQRDGTCRFTEKEASKGSLGALYGKDVLPTALRLARMC